LRIVYKLEFYHPATTSVAVIAIHPVLVIFCQHKLSALYNDGINFFYNNWDYSFYTGNWHLPVWKLPLQNLPKLVSS